MNSQADTTQFRRGRIGRVLARRRQAATQAHLVQTVSKLAAEVETLQQRLTEIERSENGKYHVPQSLAELAPLRLPPSGQTAMQAIRGRLKVDESLEDLLAQLKALQ